MNVNLGGECCRQGHKQKRPMFFINKNRWENKKNFKKRVFYFKIRKQNLWHLRTPWISIRQSTSSACAASTSWQINRSLVPRIRLISCHCIHCLQVVFSSSGFDPPFWPSSLVLFPPSYSPILFRKIHRSVSVYSQWLRNGIENRGLRGYILHTLYISSTIVEHHHKITTLTA